MNPELLFLLLAGHALCDYPLQGDYLSQLKNRHSAIGARLWHHGLGAHAIIHGGMVSLLTGSALLGLAETLIHAVTDFAKCEGWIGYDLDQGIHIGCKFAWWGIVVAAAA